MTRSNSRDAVIKIKELFGAHDQPILEGLQVWLQQVLESEITEALGAANGTGCVSYRTGAASRDPRDHPAGTADGWRNDRGHLHSHCPPPARQASAAPLRRVSRSRHRQTDGSAKNSVLNSLPAATPAITLASTAAANPNQPVRFKMMAIHFAASSEMVTLLADHGARVDVPSGVGKTPLPMAGTDGRLGSARELVTRGADINFRNGANVTPTHAAAKHSTPGMVEFFWMPAPTRPFNPGMAGFRPRLPSAMGWTPLPNGIETCHGGVNFD